CEPLRHPIAPGLSLTGIRLAIPDHALGLPVLRSLSLCTCCRHYPDAAAGRIASLIHPSRINLPRKGHRVGLRIVLFEMLWDGGEEIASIVADVNRWSTPMQKLNDLSQSRIVSKQDSTLIAVIEMSLSGWLVAGIVPGVERQSLKKLAVDES